MFCSAATMEHPDVRVVFDVLCAGCRTPVSFLFVWKTRCCLLVFNFILPQIHKARKKRISAKLFLNEVMCRRNHWEVPERLWDRSRHVRVWYAQFVSHLSLVFPMSTSSFHSTRHKICVDTHGNKINGARNFARGWGTPTGAGAVCVVCATLVYFIFRSHHHLSLAHDMRPLQSAGGCGRGNKGVLRSKVYHLRKCMLVIVREA